MDQDRHTLAPVSAAPIRLGPRMLYSIRAWRQWIRYTSERITAEHLEHNFASVASLIAPGSRVLDIGAWDCLLSQAIRDRLRCDVLGVDVVERNQTDVPFRRFDGKTLPVAEDERFDVVLLLYVLHHSADDGALLSEARRVLAPGGVVIVGEDLADGAKQRVRTVGFHVWLFCFTGMGWRGKFRTAAAWTRRFAEARLRISQTRHVGSQGNRWWFPQNVIYLLTVKGDDHEGL